MAAAITAVTGPANAQFRAGVDLVEIYATVRDEAGRLVIGLTADDFRIAEDGEPQAVAAFAEGDVPLGVAIAIDHSFSVPRRRLTQMVDAAERFLAALKPGDEAMVMAIGSRIETLTSLSTDRGPARAALGRLEPWGTTPLYDAVVEAIARVDAASGRRALVLLSDGVDRYSGTTAAGMVAEARRRNVLVYPAILGRREPADLTAVAAVTGGRILTIADPATLSVALEEVAAELRAQYMLGYSSQAPPPATPTWRTIEVSTARAGLRVRAREGYLAR